MRIRMILNVGMTAALLLLMSYGLFGEAAHEWLGVAFFALFAWHHVLNRRFLAGMCRGRFPPIRIFQILLVILMGVCVVAVTVSGIGLSRHAFTFLPEHGGHAMASRVHLASAYWGFVLMGLHVGIHWEAAVGRMRRKTPRAWPFLRAAGVALSAYGAYAFWRRGVADYLFLRAHFAFFDFAETLPDFLIDYTAMFVFFVFVGYQMTILLRKR